MLYKYGKRAREFSGRFYFYFSLVCYILGTFLITQLLTKCEVKMAGYWLSSFFACLWTETEVQYQAILTEQVWSIKDLLYGFRGNFSCGTRRVVPSGQDSSISPARVANHSAGFDLSCPLTEPAM